MIICCKTWQSLNTGQQWSINWKESLSGYDVMRAYVLCHRHQLNWWLFKISSFMHNIIYLIKGSISINLPSLFLEKGGAKHCDRVMKRTFYHKIFSDHKWCTIHWKSYCWNNPRNFIPENWSDWLTMLFVCCETDKTRILHFIDNQLQRQSFP